MRRVDHLITPAHGEFQCEHPECAQLAVWVSPLGGHRCEEHVGDLAMPVEED